MDGLNEACDGDGDGDGARAKSRDCPFSSTLPSTTGGTSLSCCLQLGGRSLREVEVGSCLATFPPPAHHPFDIPSVSSQSPPT